MISFICSLRTGAKLWSWRSGNMSTCHVGTLGKICQLLGDLFTADKRFNKLITIFQWVRIIYINFAVEEFRNVILT
jgi:hypothetical protein